MASAKGVVVVGLAIQFDLGRYHATPWGAHVNDARVEWPPSPWRILRALYGASRTHVGLTASRAAVDRVLVHLAGAPPPVYKLPAWSTGHTRHYFPNRLHSPSRLGETDRVLDAFHALDPEAELRVWWHAELDEPNRAAFVAVTSALGYLGRSESICSASVLSGEPPDEPDALPHADAKRDQRADTIELLCTMGGGHALEAITCSVSELRHSRRLVPPGTRLVEYAVRRPLPSRPAGAALERPTLARYRLQGGNRPGLREAVAVGERLRAALQGRYGGRHQQAVSRVFSGRDGDRPRADQHRHAHYLSTPSPDGRRIDHLVVWAPEGFGSGELDCLAGLTSTRIRGLPEPLRVALTAIGTEAELLLPDLLGPSSRWTSLTPFGLTRHPKRRRGKTVDGPTDQIRRELALRGHPEPLEIRLLRGGWADFRRSRVFESRLRAPSLYGATVQFDREVCGPMALGALSHFGLGLFVPTR